MRLGTRLKRMPRIVGKILWALVDKRHPLLVHVIPTRRCNLACEYCSEYDAVSDPVPTATLFARIDKLADLGTSMVSFSGGEPLMHPDIHALVARARRRGLFVSINTNGLRLSRELILLLNEAGLDHLQVSIDNVEPDRVSQKSLRLLEPKLLWLAQLADFSVAVNSVIGSGVREPEDALVIARRARELGFATSLGIVHDAQGQLRTLGPREAAVYEVHRRERRGLLRMNGWFQDNLAVGRRNEWQCRAGARFLYVDEDGLVSYCSQQRGRPGIPLLSYGALEIRREFDTKKPCAPMCTVNCVQQIALFDDWRRSPQRDPASEPLSLENSGADSSPRAS